MAGRMAGYVEMKTMYMVILSGAKNPEILLRQLADQNDRQTRKV